MRPSQCRPVPWDRKVNHRYVTLAGDVPVSRKKFRRISPDFGRVSVVALRQIERKQKNDEKMDILPKK